MKIGINLWNWVSPFRTDRDLELIERVNRLGGEVVEFAYEEGQVIDPKVLRSALTDQDLECSLVGQFGPDRDLASAQEAVRGQGMEHAKRCLDLCAEVGITLYNAAAAGTLNFDMLSDLERRTRVQRAAESLHQLGDLAAQVGVRFAFEVLNRYETNLVNTAEQALELIKLADHPAVGIHLDSFHMNMEEDSLGGAIRTAGDKLFHLHASESTRGTPGTGLLAWRELAEALQQINYDGYAVIESFDPRGRLATNVKVWRRSPAKSPDDLAREGLAFLKETLRA